MCLVVWPTSLVANWLNRQTIIYYPIVLILLLYNDILLPSYRYHRCLYCPHFSLFSLEGSGQAIEVAEWWFVQNQYSPASVALGLSLNHTRFWWRSHAWNRLVLCFAAVELVQLLSAKQELFNRHTGNYLQIHLWVVCIYISPFKNTKKIGVNLSSNKSTLQWGRDDLPGFSKRIAGEARVQMRCRLSA